VSCPSLERHLDVCSKGNAYLLVAVDVSEIGTEPDMNDISDRLSLMSVEVDSEWNPFQGPFATTVAGPWTP
jgi:hypothetical protein